MMELPRSPEDQTKRDPPDQIIGHIDPARPPGKHTVQGRIDKANRAKDLPQKSHQHNRPMDQWGPGRESVSDSIDADDHSNALPQLRKGLGRILKPCQGLVRPENDKRSPDKVVNPGCGQRPPHPARCECRFCHSALPLSFRRTFPSYDRSPLVSPGSLAG